MNSPVAKRTKKINTIIAKTINNNSVTALFNRFMVLTHSFIYRAVPGNIRPERPPFYARHPKANPKFLINQVLNRIKFIRTLLFRKTDVKEFILMNYAKKRI